MNSEHQTYRRYLVICLALLALTWAVFGQTLRFGFINYDDPLYVLQNPHIRGGVTFASIGWAFTHVHSQNWHPLTSISHMLDCQLFELNAGAHHAVNVALHSLGAILLFLFLARSTSSIWASAFAAAVFAIHPLRVESVAWISERKDVLSGLFFMLTLISYAHYARRPSLGRYVTMSILLAGGLMSKPMLVTAPLILLLLDYWPLARSTSFHRLVIEKIPLFALSLGSIVATLWAQDFALGSVEMLPLKYRLTNAVVSYVIYLGQTFWPHDLVPFYLHPENRLPLWQFAGAMSILLVVTAIAVVRRKRNPYLVVGWLWYLIMLLPVIGIVQVGLQGHADRYTYLPQIGLLIAMTWLAIDLTNFRAAILAPIAAAIVITLSILAWKQTAHWRGTESLWSYTLSVTPQSDVAHTGLAGILFTNGKIDEAIDHYRQALAMRSGNSGAQYGLAAALDKQHKVDEAIEHYEKALELQPDNTGASNAVALLFVHRGDYADAIAAWEDTLRYEPDDGNALSNLAWMLATCADRSLRNPPRAVALAQRANELANGANAIVLRTFAVALAQDRQFDRAIEIAEHGVQVADANGQASVADDLRRYLEMFRRGETPN